MGLAKSGAQVSHHHLKMTVPCTGFNSAGPGASGRSQTVRAAGPVLCADITPLVWNDGQPQPEDESGLEVEKQELFPGQERAVDFQGTFAQYGARPRPCSWPARLTESQDLDLLGKNKYINKIGIFPFSFLMLSAELHCFLSVCLAYTYITHSYSLPDAGMHKSVLKGL